MRFACYAYSIINDNFDNRVVAIIRIFCIFVPANQPMPYMSKALNVKQPGSSGCLKRYSKAPYRTHIIYCKPLFAHPYGINMCDARITFVNWHIAITLYYGGDKSSISNLNQTNTIKNVTTANKTAATFVSYISAHHYYLGF